MNAKQNPFSLYDFLGYFTPGALFIYGCFFACNHMTNQSLNLHDLKNVTFNGEPEFYIFFTLFSYLIGHIISFVSSITIERYTVLIHGHPSKCLIDIRSEDYFYISEKDKTYKTFIRNFLRFLILIVLMPITFWDFILGKLFYFRELYINPLDKLLVLDLKDKIFNLIKNNYYNKQVLNTLDHGSFRDHNFFRDYDFFRFVYHYAISHNKKHIPRMQNYLASYGFLRTASFLSIILFWCVFIFHIWPSGFKELHVTYLIIYSLIPYILYMGFVKFFKRFCLEAMMAVAVTYEMENSNKSTD